MQTKMILSIGLAFIGTLVLFSADAMNAHARPSAIEGLRLYQIGFGQGIPGEDYSETSIPARIPKGWKLIAVSAGLQPGGNSLWFQDGNGNVYLITGFYQSGKFFVSPPYAGRLEAE